MSNAKDFVIFKAGHWNGESFTVEDLDNMVRSFNADEPIPIIIGHSSDYKGRTRIPAFGRILGGLKRVGMDLVAVGVEFSDKLAEWIREGFYNQRSIELTRDNKRVLALGMLGAVPPAVKGLPGNDEALNMVAMEFSDEVRSAKVIEFAEGEGIEILEKVGSMAVEDTFKSLTEYCANFLTAMEEKMKGEMKPEMMMDSVWQLQSELVECLGLHEAFMKKVEKIEESKEGEYSQRLPGWKQFTETVKNLFNKRKESEMDQAKEKEYQERIAALDAQVKEFSEKERIATEAKAKAEADAVKAAQDAKDAQLVEGVKAFCDETVKAGKMTPAIREVDEPIMVTLAKQSPEALKSFQQKYSQPIVPLGEVAGTEQPREEDKRPLVFQRAEKYVKAHPKEFSGLTAEGAINRAVYLHANRAIKFEGE